MVDYFNDWPEIVAFVLLIIGFFISISAGSAVIAYTLTLLAGFLGGRIWFRIKKSFKIPWSIILIGFLIGFMLGSRYGNKMLILFFYVFGIMFSYYIHDKKIIKSVEF
jgi:hypothetical protein